MGTDNGRPNGASWLTPYLTVADADASLAFYQKAFGFEPGGETMPGPDGRTVHASMIYQGATIVMFSPEGAMGDPMRTPAHMQTELPLNFYVYCPDVDGLTARAREAGAVVISEPEEMFWGDRMAQFQDPDGYRWSFATNVREFDPSQVPMG